MLTSGFYSSHYIVLKHIMSHCLVLNYTVYCVVIYPTGFYYGVLYCILLFSFVEYILPERMGLFRGYLGPVFRSSSLVAF